jgi:hypothetical protein
MIYKQREYYKVEAIQLTEHNVSKAWAFIEEKAKKNSFSYNETEGEICLHGNKCGVSGYFIKVIPTEHAKEKFYKGDFFKDYISFMSEESFETYFESDENAETNS